MTAHVLTRMARGERGLVYVPPARHTRQPGRGAWRLGISREEYQAHVNAGERWCTACRCWQPVEAFGRNRARVGGLAVACREGSRLQIAAKRNVRKGQTP